MQRLSATFLPGLPAYRHFPATSYERLISVAPAEANSAIDDPLVQVVAELVVGASPVTHATAHTLSHPGTRHVGQSHAVNTSVEPSGNLRSYGRNVSCVSRPKVEYMPRWIRYPDYPIAFSRIV
jgi:hypothetical protein